MERVGDGPASPVAARTPPAIRAIEPMSPG